MELSEAGRDALGYVGGCILAASLVPQIARLVVTRSATDISILWSLLYLTGNILSLSYLLLIGALAGAIPVIFETLGGIITITLKLLFDYTDWGKEHQFKRAVLLEEQLIAAIEEQYEVQLQSDAEQQEIQHTICEDSATQQASFAGKQQPQQQLNPMLSSAGQLQLQAELAASTYYIDANYQEPPGFSSDGGATVTVQRARAARAGTLQTQAQLAAAQAAAADSHTHIFHNPLSLRVPNKASEAGCTAGSTDGTAVPSSANGSCPASSTTQSAAPTTKGSFRYSFRKRKAVSCYAPSSTAGGTTSENSITGSISCGVAVGTTAAAAATQVPALLPLALQLQQQQQLPWYLKGGISHATAMPRSSNTGSTLGSASGSTWACETATVEGRQYCCRVCGTLQLAREAGTSHPGTVRFRASLFGQPSSQHDEQQTTPDGRPASKRHSSSMPGTVLHHSSCDKVRGSGIRSGSASGQDALQQELQFTPERSSRSLSALGAYRWQAVRRKSIQLLSLTGLNNTSSTYGLDGSKSGSSGSSFQSKPRWCTQKQASVEAAAAAAETYDGLVCTPQPSEPAAAAATPAAERSRVPPNLSVIHSLPSAPRASEIGTDLSELAVSNTDLLEQQQPTQDC